jgi:hypothetical protein
VNCLDRIDEIGTGGVSAGSAATVDIGGGKVDAGAELCGESSLAVGRTAASGAIQKVRATASTGVSRAAERTRARGRGD